MPVPTRPKPGKACPRIVYLNKSTAERKEQKASWKFTRKYQNIFTHQPKMVESHSNNPLGPYFYQDGGKTYTSLPLEMMQGIQQCPHFEQMMKDCAGEGIEILKNIMAQDPRAHILTPQQYLKNVEEGTMQKRQIPGIRQNS